jgi:methionyl-tRNA synthetase
VPLVPDPATGQKPPKLLGMVEELPGRVRGAMAKTDIPTALKLIVDTLGECHVYIDQVAPWKRRDLSEHELVRCVCIVMEVCRIGAILLQPVMPDKMDRMLNYFGVAHDRRGLDYATVGADLTYYEPLTSHGPYSPMLFPQIRMDPAWNTEFRVKDDGVFVNEKSRG